MLQSRFYRLIESEFVLLNYVFFSSLLSRVSNLPGLKPKMPKTKSLVVPESEKKKH